MTKKKIQTEIQEAETVDSLAMKAVYGEERYLRRRPFLVVNTIVRPTEKARTEKAGWNLVEGNTKAFEQVEVVDRVSDKHLREAQLIIDVLNRTLVKNRFSNHSPEEVLKYYTERYAAEITQGMQVWAKQNALDIASKVEA